MSSDVQGEIARASGEPTRGLEDLKEATDETDHPDTRIIVMEDQGDPDILYIPLNFAFGINPRNSFPPSKGILPFQHIMRSFSDSHLCLKITTAPSPCYSLSSPISSSPSILLLDISERIINPLRRTKATSFLPTVEFPEDEPQSRISWCSGQEECPNWDTEYIQQWLRIDETRTALQQQQRDLLELEYDRAELEDWSLNLSSEDIRDGAWRKSNEILTPGQISLSTLPSIQENNALELEEDSNEDLWNNSSYMMDKTGGELVALLMDAPANNQLEKRWPYAVNGHITSPGDSWSSAETNSEDCFHSYEQETCSKRSSAALSGCSDDTNESHAVGTDFTRDFYRLVKFESTKSLASISSKSAAGCLSDCDREQALQNVLTFIAEQQLYCHTREENDSRPNSALRDEQTKDFNIEAPPQNIEEITAESELTNGLFIGDNISKQCSEKFNENYVNIKQLCSELVRNEQNKVINEEHNDIINICEDEPCNSPVQTDTYLMNGDISNDTFNCHSVKINSEQMSSDNINLSDVEKTENILETTTESTQEPLSPSLTESQTSSVSTPDTIVSRIPRRQISRSSTPLRSSPKTSPLHSKKIPVAQTKNLPKTKIPSKDNRNPKQNSNPNSPNHVNQTPKNSPKNSPKQKQLKPSKLQQPKEVVNKPVISSERLPQCTSGLLSSSVIDGPPHRAVSFHERATSKDVIDELNRIIRKGEDNGSQEEILDKNRRLDEACRPTGWIHVEKTIDLNDPKVSKKLLN